MAVDNSTLMEHGARKPRTGVKSPRQKTEASTILSVFVALVAVGATLAPILYIITGGFRTNQQLLEDPAGLPDPWVLEKYGQVLVSSDFWSQVANSTWVAAMTTLGVVLFATMAAYPLARYQFRGREFVYVLFTLGLMFPIGVAALPLYILIRDLGLIGSLWGVIIPQVAFQLPLTVIIMRPFIQALPKELEEAAAIDGMSRVGFFWHMVLPLSRPAMMTVGVLAFVTSWNAFLLPLLILQGDPAGQTLPMGVQAFQSRYSSDTAAILAFTSLAMLPALAFFAFMERRLVDGLTGAVKG